MFPVRLVSDYVSSRCFLLFYVVTLTSYYVHSIVVFTAMELLSKPDVTCKECLVATTIVLRKLGNPVMTNLYYNNIKLLLERATSCLIDSQVRQVLIFRPIHINTVWAV